MTAAIVVGGVGAIAATHGDPWGFVKRQWHGFSHPGVSASSSHFTSVGSGRYDFWRVSLDAVAGHPIGGLGQDNFADYYLPRRRASSGFCYSAGSSLPQLSPRSRHCAADSR